MCSKMEEWFFSSFLDFAGLRVDTICNKELAVTLLELDLKNFIEDSYRYAVDDDNIF